MLKDNLHNECIKFGRSVEERDRNATAQAQ